MMMTVLFIDHFAQGSFTV